MEHVTANETLTQVLAEAIARHDELADFPLTADERDALDAATFGAALRTQYSMAHDPAAFSLSDVGADEYPTHACTDLDGWRRAHAARTLPHVIAAVALGLDCPFSDRSEQAAYAAEVTARREQLRPLIAELERPAHDAAFDRMVSEERAAVRAFHSAVAADDVAAVESLAARLGTSKLEAHHMLQDQQRKAFAASVEVISRAAQSSKASTTEHPGAVEGRQPAADRSPFRLIEPTEYAALRPGRWHIKGMLPAAELGVLFGAPGSGKSFLAFDLGLAIARGVPWRGHKVKPGRVVYIAGEGTGGMGPRLHAYCTAQNVPLQALDQFRIIERAPNLLQPDHPQQVVDAILAAGGADLVIVDTLARSMVGGDENSSEAMGTAIANCKAIHARTGATVVLVHHAGKDVSKGARGHSSLHGAADFELSVCRAENSADLRLVRVEKMKDGEDQTELGFTLRQVRVGTDEDGDPITSCVVEAAEVEVKKRQAAGAMQRAVISALEMVCDADGMADVEEVVNVVVADAAREGKTVRKANVRQVIQRMDGEYVVLAGGRIGVIR